ncbi:VOC family protein [Streptomyces sp. NPDC127063]|uniref:VOC family protein n=1 Tax=Streptomyces sp. NPDC127063 TaxID=3347123 RepID=UPI003653FCB5
MNPARESFSSSSCGKSAVTLPSFFLSFFGRTGGRAVTSRQTPKSRPSTKPGPKQVNFRVRDLDAMLTQLRAAGADVAEETQQMDGVGRFGWVTDPEGNRIELWQPA